jgi:hypothetical protein
MVVYDCKENETYIQSAIAGISDYKSNNVMHAGSFYSSGMAYPSVILHNSLMYCLLSLPVSEMDEEKSTTQKA